MEAFEEVRRLISPKLTWEIFEEVLRKQHDSSSVKLHKITLGKPAKVGGDSNLSSIVRFSVEYSCGSNCYTLHVISKALVKNIGHQKTIRNTDFFQNEILFYEYVWPQLDAFQRRMKCPKLFGSIPKYLNGYYDGTNDYVLLEDLGFQSYEGFARSEALTLDRAKIVLKILAQFHALGYAFKETEPELFQQTANNLKERYFHENFRWWYINFHNKLKEITFDAVQKELPEKYCNRFQEIMDRDIFKEASMLCAPNAPTKYKTFTHGDTWMPNFLTRFDAERQPQHSVMIDFQLARYASLAQDINFFIYACTDAQLRAVSYEEMLQFYCQEFNAYVKLVNPQLMVNGPILNYDLLIEELKMIGSFSLCMSMEGCIGSMVDDEDFVYIGNVEGEEALPLESVWNVQTLKEKEKRVKLAEMVKHMVDYNFI